MFWSGLQFGMLLQLAVGPLCLYVFNQGTLAGFGSAWAGVWGVVLGDALYMLTAWLGLASWLRSAQTQRALRFFGGAVLVLFGANILHQAWGRSVFPAWSALSPGRSFLQAWILTLANPLTILFWAGVWAARTAEKNVSRESLIRFAAGALAAGLIFLTVVAELGAVLHRFLPPLAVQALNLAVGVVMVGLGIRLAFRHPRPRPKGRR
jgi:threonine/homoserine/homoserine lactone efflux protein